MNTAYDRVGQDQPKSQPVLESHARGFCNRAEEVVKITSALNEIANRAFGREVSGIGDSKSVPAPTPESGLAKLSESGEFMDKAITALGRAVGRFESL